MLNLYFVFIVINEYHAFSVRHQNHFLFSII